MKSKKPILIAVLQLLMIISSNDAPCQNSAENSYENQIDYLVKKGDFDKQLWEKTLNIFNRIIIIDCHSHQPFRLNSNPEQINYNYLETYKNVGMVHGFPLRRESAESISERIFKDIKNFKRQSADSSYSILIVDRSNDFNAAIFNNQIPFMIHLESFEGLAEGKISNLQQYYNEGVRMVGFNQSGLDTVWLNDKLTDYGTDFIKELNRLGIICDITHIRRTIQNQAIEMSGAPVIISHGGAFNKVNSVFNTPDSLLKKLTLKGGMIGVSFFSGQLSANVLLEINNGAEWDKTSRASIEELIDHIDYLKSLVGIDFIGIGTDYGGSGIMSPGGLETIDGFPLIIYYLLKRGYSEEEIEKVSGLNFINFFKRVEAKAEES